MLFHCVKKRANAEGTLKKGGLRSAEKKRHRGAGCLRRTAEHVRSPKGTRAKKKKRGFWACFLKRLAVWGVWEWGGKVEHAGGKETKVNPCRFGLRRCDYAAYDRKQTWGRSFRPGEECCIGGGTSRETKEGSVSGCQRGSKGPRGHYWSKTSTLRTAE